MLLAQNKRVLAEIAAQIAGGLAGGGSSVDAIAIADQAVQVASAIDQVVARTKSPFADDAQAIRTLKRLGYKVFREREFEGEAFRFLEKRDYKIRKRQKGDGDD